MSSAGPPGGAAAAPAPAPQRYFCHYCDCTVTLTPFPDGEVSCPICHDGFVEEFDDTNPYPNPDPVPDHEPHLLPLFTIIRRSRRPLHPSATATASASASASGVPFFLPHRAVSFDLRSPGDLAGLLGPEPSPARPAADPDPFDPFHFLQNHLQHLMDDGAVIQVVMDGGGGRGSGSLGDYFFGAGLEQLIQQIAENDPNRYGTPPASKSAVDSLADVKISQNPLASDEAQCAVCMDLFVAGMEAKQMPCKHIYHKDCILPWLALHNSCPVCRYELPTDDPDYEHRASGPPAVAGSAAAAPAGSDIAGGEAASTAGAPGPWNMSVVRRRFMISLPRPLRAPGSPVEASTTPDGGNSGGNGGGGADTNSGER